MNIDVKIDLRWGVFFVSLMLIFMVLKIFKIISWSWIWVFSPIWIPVLFAVFLFLLAVILCKFVL